MAERLCYQKGVADVGSSYGNIQIQHWKLSLQTAGKEGSRQTGKNAVSQVMERLKRLNKQQKTIAVAAMAVLAVLLVLLIIKMTGPKVPKIASGTPITEKNLPEVSDILRAAEMSDIDLFETWVYEYYESSNGERESSAYSDTDSLMTAMLLADDQVSCNGAEEYKGEYLKDDVYKLENEDAYILIRDNLHVFTTLFGEMKVPEGGLEKALPENWKKYGLKLYNEHGYIVSVVVSRTKTEAVTGHAGILIDCKTIGEKTKSRYLFVEKVAKGGAFAATWLDSTDDLMTLLSARTELQPGEGEAAPLVYLNDKLLGELKSS